MYNGLNSLYTDRQTCQQLPVNRHCSGHVNARSEGPLWKDTVTGISGTAYYSLICLLYHTYRGEPIKNTPLGKILYLYNCSRFFFTKFSFYRGGFRHICSKFHYNIWFDSKITINLTSRYSGIFNTQLHVHLKSLICCIRWTISILSMKFAGYVVWILKYKIWKFGSNPH